MDLNSGRPEVVFFIVACIIFTLMLDDFFPLGMTAPEGALVVAVVRTLVIDTIGVEVASNEPSTASTYGNKISNVS